MTIDNIPLEDLIEARQKAQNDGLDWKNIDSENLIKMYSNN